MAIADRHSLTNLPGLYKVLASFALIVGLGLFVAEWFIEVRLLAWETSASTLLGWGHHLLLVKLDHPALFWALFIAHIACLALVIGVTSLLLRKLAIARGARRALIGLLVAVGTFDLLCWLLLPYWETASTLLGYGIALEAALLIFSVLRPLAEMWVYRRWRGTGGKPVHVVIVGGGFAGLYTAMHLDAALGYHRDLKITVIDRRNYFLFPPLLPSVAAGAIETRQVTYPFRRIFEATNVTFKKERVDRIDTDKKLIHARVDVDDDPVTGEPQVIYCDTPYDYLVLAPVSDSQTFNTPGVAEHAFFMRELGDAIAVRNHIIDCFERAARETDQERRREQLTFVIVGAGPTGVELASEVRDLIDHVLMSRYPEVEPDEVRVIVVQSGPQILPGWHESIVTSATGRLTHLRVDLRLGRKVVKVTGFSVELDGNEKICTRTTVWCAGVKPSALLTSCGLTLHKNGRAELEPDLRVKGKDDLFVLGDAAFLLGADGKPLPPLGQVAFQQGQHAANNIVRLLCKQSTRSFKYFDYGSLVSVGEHFAAVDLLGIRLSGFLAWWIWRTLYLVKLVGFANKVRVMIDWTLDLIVERSIAQIAADRQDFTGKQLENGAALAPRPGPPPP